MFADITIWAFIAGVVAALIVLGALAKNLDRNSRSGGSPQALKVLGGVVTAVLVGAVVGVAVQLLVDALPVA